MVWRINENLEKSDFQRDSMKFTGQTILRSKIISTKEYIIQCIWREKTESTNSGKDPLSVPLYSQK